MIHNSLQQEIEELLPTQQTEVLKFIRFLKFSQKPAPRAKQKKMNFSWADGLSDLKEQYTSVELQQQALLWR